MITLRPFSFVFRGQDSPNILWLNLLIDS